MFEIALDEVVGQRRATYDEIGIPKIDVGNRTRVAGDSAITSETEENVNKRLDNVSKIAKMIRLNINIAYNWSKTLKTQRARAKYLGEYTTGRNGIDEGLKEMVKS